MIYSLKFLVNNYCFLNFKFIILIVIFLFEFFKVILKIKKYILNQFCNYFLLFLSLCFKLYKLKLKFESYKLKMINNISLKIKILLFNIFFKNNNNKRIVYIKLIVINCLITTLLISCWFIFNIRIYANFLIIVEWKFFHIILIKFLFYCWISFMFCYFIYDVIQSTNLLSNFNIIFNNHDRLLENPLLIPFYKFSRFIIIYLNVSPKLSMDIYDILGFIFFIPVYFLSSILYLFVYRNSEGYLNFFKSLIFYKSVCIFGYSKANIIKTDYLRIFFYLLSILNLLTLICILLIFVYFKFKWILHPNPKQFVVVQKRFCSSTPVPFKYIFFHNETKISKYKKIHPVIANFQLCKPSILFTHSGKFNNIPLSKTDLLNKPKEQFCTQLDYNDKLNINWRLSTIVTDKAISSKMLEYYHLYLETYGNGEYENCACKCNNDKSVIKNCCNLNFQELQQNKNIKSYTIYDNQNSDIHFNKKLPWKETSKQNNKF